MSFARSQYLLVVSALAVGCFSPNEPSESGTDTTEDGSGTTPMPTSSSDVTTGGSATDPMTGPNTTGPGTTANPTMTDPTDDTGTESGDTGTGTQSESDTVGRLCGNGDVDPEEVCDDGNDVNGDGCNVDCVESGTVRWTATYDDGDERATSLTIDEDDNILILAWTGPSSREFSDWQRVYSADGDALNSGMTSRDFYSVMYDGEDIVGVFDDPSGSGDQTSGWPFIVGGFSADGDEQWSQSLGGQHHVARVAATPDGGLVIGGGIRGLTAYDYGHSAFATAFDNSGSPAWADEAGNSATLAACSAVSANDEGSIVVACYADNDVLLRRYSATGTMAWERDVEDPGSWPTPGFSNRQPFQAGLEQNSDGEIAFAMRDVVMKFDLNGNETWRFEYSGGGDAWINDAAILEDGSVVFVGDEVSASGDNGRDIFVRKLTASGDAAWFELVDGSAHGDDFARHVAVDHAEDIVVYGTTLEDGSENDLWLRKYAP